MDNTVAIRSNLADSAGGQTGSSSGVVVPVSPADSQEVLKQIKRTTKKVEGLEEMLQNRLSVVANEVCDSLLKNMFLEYVVFGIYKNMFFMDRSRLSARNMKQEVNVLRVYN